MDKSRQVIPTGSVKWEEICEHCGRCCYEKYEYRGKVFYADKPCQYLDLETKHCRIYEQRSELNPECAHLTPELIPTGILPADCPYMTRLKDFKTDE